MKNSPYIPDVVDFAHQIINMQIENEHLRHEVEHYKSMHEQHCEQTTRSIKSSREFTGILLKAALDPDSVINRGHAALIKEEVENNGSTNQN